MWGPICEKDTVPSAEKGVTLEATIPAGNAVVDRLPGLKFIRTKDSLTLLLAGR